MKKKGTIAALLFNVLMAVFLITLFAPAQANVSSVMLVTLALCAISFIKINGVAFMALQVEIWREDIVNNLYKNNEFAQRCVNADRFVLMGKVVHIPVSGSPSQVKMNLTSFPQTAVNRNDSEITYVLDTAYSLPRQIQDIEKYELSYDKRQSVVGEDQQYLIQSAMDSLLFRWAPAAAKVIATSGNSSSADLIDGIATGNRKLFTKTEFKQVVKKMRQANMVGKITALLTVAHYHQFIESLSEGEKTAVGAVANLKEGVVGRYYGADIMFRSTVLRYRKVNDVYTPVDTTSEDFTPGTDDCAASLFYSDAAVERAVGDVVVFDQPNNPLYYGDVFSQYIRIGGRIRRADGVYAVVEDLVGA